jgi:hypothetical protein
LISASARLAAREFGVDELRDHRSAETDVLGFVNLAHAAFADSADEAVFSVRRHRQGLARFGLAVLLRVSHWSRRKAIVGQS